ncbi:MAG: signal peptidase I [Candidatus Omnitrophica bacterium]|nr:signal peptidase I [Candidatus Omnitrophota bacterium]
MKLNPKIKQNMREWAEAIVIAFVLAMIIRTFVVQAFKIPTGSMRPTLIEGDRIFVNKFIYKFKEPNCGDVIVFRYPENRKKDFIKRLIAKPGEKVEIRDGSIWINNKLVQEPEQVRRIRYYNSDPNMIYCTPGNVLSVPEDSYFVLGDNSASSRDSRYWGFVKRNDILGKAMVIYWPLTRVRKIE